MDGKRSSRAGKQTPTNKEDLELLKNVLAHNLSEYSTAAFEGMLHDLMQHPTWELTIKQREWVTNEAEKRGVPKYENLVSRGLVPRGKEVPLPEVLTVLPKRPPGRR
jgi:hypothetical protein